MMPEFLELVNRILSICKTVPDEIAEIWLDYFNGFVVAAAGTSSKYGWIVETLTTQKVHYKGANPEAKKFLNKGDEQQMSF